VYTLLYINITLYVYIIIEDEAEKLEFASFKKFLATQMNKENAGDGQS